MLDKSYQLTHVDQKGKASMVDVGNKNHQLRTAKGYGKIKLAKKTIELIRENFIKKGDVLTIAQIAGIQAAKWTPQLIPLCHQLNITKVEVVTNLCKDGVEVTSTVRCIGQTGVEMEALTAVNVALLTVYDMCKAVDKNMVMEKIYLVEKNKEDIK